MGKTKIKKTLFIELKEPLFPNAWDSSLTQNPKMHISKETKDFASVTQVIICWLICL